MAGFQLARIALDSPITFDETWGDPVTNTGGAPVPAIRTAIRHSVSLPLFTAPITEDTVAHRLRARRQLRSLLNNAPYKMTGLFMSWEDDPEQEGWYIPDQGQLVQGAEAPLTHGWWNLQNFAWFKLGAPRTHRGAALLSVKDLRTGLTARDTLRRVYSTDFSGLAALALTYLPAGVSDVANTASLAAVPVILLPVGSDTGQTGLVTGQLDLTVLSYERTAASQNLGDVVAYDQREQSGLPTLGEDPQDFGWEEIYGPDYPYTAGLVPVLQNGLCRVRYDGTHTPGFRVDVWTGSKWEEQGKMLFYDDYTSSNTITLISASVREYTPDRAVIEILTSTAGSGRTNREQIFITLQRGWSGPRFELYCAPQGGEAGAGLLEWWQSAIGENTSTVKIDIAAHIDATAGTGSTSQASEYVGSNPFSGENEGMVLRQGAVYQHNLASLAAQGGIYAEAASAAYGVTTNGMRLSNSVTAVYGWTGGQLGFARQQPDQIMEAENMTLGTGTTSTADAAASGGKAATATRTTDANPHTTRATWPNGKYGTYRVMARVKTSVGTSIVKIYAKTGATTGATFTSNVTTYTWVDLGDVVANNTTLEIHAWLSAAGTVSVDRIEAFLVEDRQTAHGGTFSGGRDLGESVLTDARVISTCVVR